MDFLTARRPDEQTTRNALRIPTCVIKRKIELLECIRWEKCAQWWSETLREHLAIEK